MTGNPVSACWFPPLLQQRIDALPGGAIPLVKRYQRDAQSLDVVFQRLSIDALNCIASFLRERRERVLRQRSVDDIARVLDAAAEKWLDSSYALRQQAIEQIALITGFSPEMTAHSIDLEQKSSRYPHLMQALTNELGNPSYLDSFQSNHHLGGLTRTQGPGLVGAIFSSNIPALPHLEVVRSFLVKAACLGRVSAGEPIFLALYAQTLHEIDPDIGSCLAVIYWDRGDQESEDAFLGLIDYLIAYGGEPQMNRLAATKPADLEATWHGHRMGFTYLCRDALVEDGVQELAKKVAYDFSIFDGHACLCPQVCFVETGGDVSPLDFARDCAAAMSEWVVTLPPRRLSLSEASEKYHRREIYLMRESMGEALRVVEAPEDLSFLVVLESMDEFEVSSMDRFIRVVPVNDLADAKALLKPMRKYLQCAALAGGASGVAARPDLGSEIASWGVSRIVPPGIIGTPSMMWRHDGMPCLSKMVTWCDYEQVAPQDLLSLTTRDCLEEPQPNYMAKTP